MEDFDRYGDYTEYEDDIPKGKKNPVMLILKILVAIVCISVIGIFAFRLILFNYYPDSVSNIYFTEKLTQYYNETDGNIVVHTQELRSPYDDPDVANFFCDNLIVIPATGELQLSVRYNNSAIENIKTKLNLESLDPSDKDYDNYGNIYEPPTHISIDSLLMYHYYKLSFDGIPFLVTDGTYPEWIRLEVFVKGQKSAEPFSKILVYENHENFSEFEEYDLSGEERPQ